MFLVNILLCSVRPHFGVHFIFITLVLVIVLITIIIHILICKLSPITPFIFIELNIYAFVIFIVSVIFFILNIDDYRIICDFIITASFMLQNLLNRGSGWILINNLPYLKSLRCFNQAEQCCSRASPLIPFVFFTLTK